MMVQTQFMRPNQKTKSVQFMTPRAHRGKGTRKMRLSQKRQLQQLQIPFMGGPIMGLEITSNGSLFSPALSPTSLQILSHTSVQKGNFISRSRLKF